MRRNILLIDDDPICNLISRKLLDRIDANLVVHTVPHGKEAIALIERLFSTGKPRPDLILLDLNMPVMDGFQFLSAFRKLFLPQEYHPMIVIVSSSMDPADTRRAFEFGVGDYLQKPLSENVLRIALESTLDKHSYAV